MNISMNIRRLFTLLVMAILFSLPFYAQNGAYNSPQLGGGGGGSGTVTSVSTGNLSPLFTAAIANPTTTPALSFTISNAGALSLLGNPTGSAAAPVYTSSPVVSGSMTTGSGGTVAGAIQLGQGTANSTGTTAATLEAPAAVTSYVLNVPAAAPTNNNSAMLFTNAAPGVGTFAKMPQTAILTSQYTNSTTSFTTVTGGNTLQFSVEASTNYLVVCHLYYQAASTGGLNIQWTGPASPTAVAIGLNNPIALGTTDNSVATAFSTSLGNVVTTAATNFDAVVSLGLVNGVNAGTIVLQAKSSAAVQLQIQAGSYCQAQ